MEVGENSKMALEIQWLSARTRLVAHSDNVNLATQACTARRHIGTLRRHLEDQTSAHFDISHKVR